MMSLPPVALKRGGAATASTFSATRRWCQPTRLPLPSRPAFRHVMGHRPRPRRGEVVLARQDQLDRLLGDVGEHDRLRHRVGPDAPAVAAAEQVLVHADLVGRGLEHVRGHERGERRRLRAGPDLGRLAVGARPWRRSSSAPSARGSSAPTSRSASSTLAAPAERRGRVALLEPVHRLGVRVAAVRARTPPSPSPSRSLRGVARRRCPTSP